MNFKEFADLVVAAAKNAGLTEYELYHSGSESTSVSTFGNEVKSFSSSVTDGICFRAIVNGKMGYAATEELSADSAKRLVEVVMDNAASLESEEKVFLAKPAPAYASVEENPNPVPSPAELTDFALKMQSVVAQTDPMVKMSETQVFTDGMSLDIINSNGVNLHYQNHNDGMFSNVIVAEGEVMSDDFAFEVKPLKDIDLKDVAAKAVDKAKKKLSADVAPTGAYPVVFAPGAVHSLLGTFSSIFSSENTQKGLSRLGGQVGTKIASDKVTLVDDPFCKDVPLQMPFDDEGMPTAKKNVIENGELKTLLYNLKTAAVDGVASTGNAHKGSYASKVGIAPFSMYIAPGILSEDELLAQVGNGVYIESLGGMHAGANPISGDFSLQSSGFMIENGVKTTAVKSFTVAGNFYSLLQNITEVASNLKFPMPMGSTNFGSPSIRVDGLTIAGK